ncbi:hypothetical protein [Polyangium mundeleinium]|uniref:Uncharacterized protein n=1 Tax=Polyangium mundeleinium TaxID=2995306 RepID=A0ABT5F0E0_9BACT|nr:hypothetical protein [Polyangium mundeleinium]MDC0747481.1 hypothetical protein [Polyangium mundeleinium]
MTSAWPWITLALLGAYHGLSPGMGWLFAVALGLQEKSGKAVLRALLPIAIGHAASVGLAVGLLAAGKASIPTGILPWITGGVLVAFGIFKLVRPRHPRWVGMRVNARDLVVWSFLMATAHGAGLMLLPVFVLGEDNPAPCHGPSCHDAAGISLSSPSGYLAAISLHTLAMLAVSALVALVVYYKVGLAMLRRAWFDLDRVWAGALILAGVLGLLL